MNRIELTVLRNLISNEPYMRRVLPFLKEEYFSEQGEKSVFNLVNRFIEKYNKPPTVEALEISLQETKLGENVFKEAVEIIRDLNGQPASDVEWLIDQTERFCKDKAVYNAILQSITIIDGKDKVYQKEAIPSLLQDALGVSFDTTVGHDYFKDSEERFDYYNRLEERIPFDLELFNKCTNGGLPNKTLNIVLAGTGVGKSLFMCHMAAACIAQGKNVLYITLEMAEERIAERIDSNLLNIDIAELGDVPKGIFTQKINKLRDRVNGRLIIKEYPTATAHVGHFKSLLNELKLKRKFVPDIIFVDYLNICSSSRLKPGGSTNSYTYVKSIAEELRGLAVEFNVPVVSATQTTRSGYSNTDVELTDTSESFGLPATADFMFALISTDELDQLNQLMVKQLKNRYKDLTKLKRFMIGIDRKKMRLFDLEPSAQKNISDSGTSPDDADNIDFASFLRNRNKK